MKIGIFLMPVDPPAGAGIQERWQEVIEAAEVAEEVGFDGVFLPEHHFMPEGFCTSPLIALAAIAARTKSIRLGTATVMLPGYHPIRIAEDGALLDILSAGRLILGVGLGIEEELKVFGVQRKERVSWFEECLEIIRRAWLEDSLSFFGRHYSFADIRVTPRPIQQPSPPIWMGAMSKPGLVRAGRCGLPWLSDPLHNLDVMCRWASMYRQAAFGRNHSPSVILMRDGWVTEDKTDVEKVWWPFAQKEHWRYVSEVPRYVAGTEPWLSQVRSIDDLSLEAHHVDRLVVGQPSEVIDTLNRFARAIPTDYVIIRFRMPTGPSHEETLRCIRLFGEQVIPCVVASGERDAPILHNDCKGGPRTGQTVS